MTETLTGKQVLALLAQDEPPEIEYQLTTRQWLPTSLLTASTHFLRNTPTKYRIKPTPQRRLSVTLANGEVVSWPEPVRDIPKEGTKYFVVLSEGDIDSNTWYGDSTDTELFAFGNVHLTREAAQEHADALRKINTQGAGK